MEDQFIKRSLYLSLAALFVLLGQLGCENGLEPFERNSGFYSIYGAMDLHRDLHFVRVKDLNALLLSDSTRNLDVTVSLINLDSGVADVLEDSVVAFDSVFTHNFRIPYSLETGTNYRLLVEGDDGGMAWADTYTPEFVEVRITPDQPVYKCSEEMEISFIPVLNRNDLTLIIALELGGIIYDASFSLSSGEEEDEWTTSPFPTVRDIIDYIIIKNRLNDPPFPPTYTCSDLSDNMLFVNYIHYSPDFFEQNESDTTSVTGGAGRFGAFYRDSLTITIDTARACAPNCP